jgi:hypothetical protein
MLCCCKAFDHAHELPAAGRHVVLELRSCCCSRQVDVVDKGCASPVQLSRSIDLRHTAHTQKQTSSSSS